MFLQEKMRGWGFLLSIILLAYVAQKDYKEHVDLKTPVRVGTWICYKTRIVWSTQTKAWNQTLFQRSPGLYTKPYKGNKPIEDLFTFTDMIRIPYSQEAASMNLHPNWREGDALCLIVDDVFLCNLFDGCWYWPLIAIFKIKLF